MTETHPKLSRLNTKNGKSFLQMLRPHTHLCPSLRTHIHLPPNTKLNCTPHIPNLTIIIYTIMTTMHTKRAVLPLLSSTLGWVARPVLWLSSLVWLSTSCSLSWMVLCWASVKSLLEMWLVVGLAGRHLLVLVVSPRELVLAEVGKRDNKHVTYVIGNSLSDLSHYVGLSNLGCLQHWPIWSPVWPQKWIHHKISYI